MSASMNRVFLCGNLTRDPETAQTASGATVCKIRLAVNETFRGKDGETREVATFLDVTAWGPLAERCGQFLGKGRQVLVEGRLYVEQWTDGETGKQRQQVRVRADRVGFLGGAPSAEGTPPRESRIVNRESRPAGGAAPHAPAATPAAQAPAGDAADLPF